MMSPIEEKDTEYGSQNIAQSLSYGAETIDARTAEELAREEDAHIGVRRVEAAKKVFGRYSYWVLFISLGLASYIYSLDSSTTSNYLTFAASSFGEHSLISSVQVAQSIIIAVGKPVIAKVADVSSRAYAYFGVLIFYVLGYIVIASAQAVSTIAGGIVIYAVGYTGLQVLTQIIIADITTLQWRGLVSSLTSLPFIVNGFVGPNIATSVLSVSGWRWGYGMFAILVPASLLPLILTLFWAEQKAKRLGIVDAALANSNDSTRTAGTFEERFTRAVVQLDLIGLLLLGAAVSLILLPLTLAEDAKGQWKNPSMVAMLIVGIISLFVFIYWDIRYASKPVIASRFLRNRSVTLTSLIGFFDFFSFYLTYVYLYSFILIVKPWSTLNSTYFMQTQSMALTVFGVVAGIAMCWTQRYKSILIFGLCIRFLGCALMIHSRGANASTAELVWTQILQGAGGFSSAAMQVGAQASVTHADVAMVTAIVLLITEIGGAIGSAVAGAIWSSTMPDNLAKNLPQLSEEQRAELFGSITNVLAYPRGDPVREGVISAYDATMKKMIIAATVLSIIPIILALFLPNWYLGNTQNAIDQTNLEGEVETQEERP